jgi:hypothetical protein
MSKEAFWIFGAWGDNIMLQFNALGSCVCVNVFKILLNAWKVLNSFSQENSFIPELDMSKEAFWKEVKKITKDNEMHYRLLFQKHLLRRYHHGLYDSKVF